MVEGMTSASWDHVSLLLARLVSFGEDSVSVLRLHAALQHSRAQSKCTTRLSCQSLLAKNLKTNPRDEQEKHAHFGNE